MNAPLLKTKLYTPPPRSELVPRPRLTERLQPDLNRKLVLVSAPAGFGKTTLVSEWIKKLEIRAAWLSLDKGDDDPLHFLTYLIAALQTVKDDLAPSLLNALQSPQPPPVESVLAALINELADVPFEFALVLDDYHLISATAVHDALAFLLKHLPPQMRLVIVTRKDPLLPLARLRVRGQMIEIRAADLRFTLPEAAEFLNRAMRLELSGDDVAALEARTEGWIAGLQLAALALQNQDAARASGFIAAFAGDDRYVVDYLVDEVLEQRPQGTRDFLLQTSILERLSGPLCDAVLGVKNELSSTSDHNPLSTTHSQTTLETLEQANLFIVPLDNKRQWYRYHHLFAELLRARLSQSQPELLPELHRRASAWYAANDLRSKAINHSLAAKDWERVAQLIDQVFNQVLGGSAYFTTVLGWLDALPQEVVRARPGLGIVRAWMLQLMLQAEAAELCLQELENTASGSLPDEIQVQVIAIRAFLARQRKDADTAIKLSLKVLEALANGVPATKIVLPLATLNLANSYLMRGDMVQAQRQYSQMAALAQGAGITLALAVANGQAAVQTVAGKLRQAVETYRQGLQLVQQTVQRTGQTPPAVSYIHVGLAHLLREQNEFEQAASYLEQGLEVGRQWQIGMTLCNGYVAQVRLKLAQGDLAGAQKVMRQAEQLPRAFLTAPRFMEPIDVCQARLLLAQARLSPANTAAVQQWLKEHGLGDDDSLSAVHVSSLDNEYEHLIWARLLILQDQPAQAWQLLARLQQAAEGGGRTGNVIEILALQALAQQARGDVEQALAALGQALTLAAPEGYVRLFLDEGPPMTRLLSEAAARGIAPDYARKLLAAYEEQTKDKGRTTEPRASSSVGCLHPHRPASLVEPLSERELEVLGLVAEGLSNQEIASRLYLSLNTVKAHTRNIYGKMGVNSRTQAVSRARELGIL